MVLIISYLRNVCNICYPFSISVFVEKSRFNMLISCPPFLSINREGVFSKLNELLLGSLNVEQALDIDNIHCLIRPYEFLEHHTALYFLNEFVRFFR